MAAHAAGTQEVISRGSPAWQRQKMIAIISRSKTHITLAFAPGASFSEPHGLLAGEGRTTRHVKAPRGGLRTGRWCHRRG
jgi:hypothetical protein